MTDQSKVPGRAERRLFLRGAGLAAVAAPLVAAGVKAETLAQPTNHQVAARYVESEHVKRFYALNRR